MPIADQGVPVRPADVERWLDELGLRPDARSDREGVTSWDLRLDGRRRFDVPVTLILDPLVALISGSTSRRRSATPSASRIGSCCAGTTSSRSRSSRWPRTSGRSSTVEIAAGPGRPRRARARDRPVARDRRPAPRGVGELALDRRPDPGHERPDEPRRGAPRALPRGARRARRGAATGCHRAGESRRRRRRRRRAPTPARDRHPGRPRPGRRRPMTGRRAALVAVLFATLVAALAPAAAAPRARRGPRADDRQQRDATPSTPTTASSTSR